MATSHQLSKISMSDTLSGQIIAGRYRLIKKLGRGGMAEVYLARQESLDRDVAVKLMHTFLQAEEDFLHRFKREAKAMAALNHPNIVSVYDFDAYGENTYYLVMEYIGGGALKDTLEELAQKGERLPLERSIEITLQVLDALAYAHARGMIHRDIKPANIMLDESGKAIITDFGIVKLVGGQSSVGYTATATGALIGTPSYMSPEQALGKPGDERVDIYSVGVMLFQMVTGQLPFTADTPLAVVMKHVNDPAPLPMEYLPTIPTGLQSIILKALAKNPEDRYSSAKEMAKALRGVDLAGVSVPTQITPPATTIVTPPTATIVQQTASVNNPTTAVSAGQTAVSTTPPARPPWLYVGIGLAALLLVAFLVFGTDLFGGGEEETVTETAVIAIVTDTAEPSTTPTPEIANTIPPDETPEPDVLGTLVADLTRAAQPTITPTPSATPSPTATAAATPDATAEFLAGCTAGVELTAVYTFQNPNSNFAAVGTNFPVNWVLKNSGTCPWPVGLQWQYVTGEDFDYAGDPIELAEEVLAEDEITLTAAFKAPTTVNTFNSTWQFVDEAGEPFGPEIEFQIRTYVPVTATPRPTNTPVAAATATTAVTELNFAFEILSCEYQESDWQCTLRLTPYGGGGGPYTIFVFDQPAGQATEFRAPWPATYFPRARRCFAFNTEFRVVDDATGQSFSRHIYIDPDDVFPGGCVLP